VFEKKRERVKQKKAKVSRTELLIYLVFGKGSEFEIWRRGRDGGRESDGIGFSQI